MTCPSSFVIGESDRRQTLQSFVTANQVIQDQKCRLCEHDPHTYNCTECHCQFATITEKDLKVETTKYVRKPFYVEAVQVTDLNIDEVAKWCGGEINKQPGGKEFGAAQKFIFVKSAINPTTERQSKAFVNDWVLVQNRNFKVYTDKAFTRNFEIAPEVTL